MDWLVNSLREFCQRQGFTNTCWIGYSGGLDSHVLLHLLATLRSDLPLKLHAVYINHGLSPNAEKWAEHCADVCRTLQIDFTQRSLEKTLIPDQSPEESARTRRYAVFSELLATNDVLLTAHHQDDQAETVLLQLFRGAGPKGLAAMPALKSFAKGFHARPLLAFSRAEILDYANQHQLQWIEDESNLHCIFTRNFVRHDIMPALKKRWPSVSNTLARVAENCAEAQTLLNEMAQDDLVLVRTQEEKCLSVKALLTLSPARQRNVLRAWFQQLHFPIPPAVKLHQMQHDMLSARSDKAPHFTWQHVELRRYRDNLYAMLRVSEHLAQPTTWHLSDALHLPNIGTLHAVPMRGEGLRADIQQVTVRFRTGGETIQLPGRPCHHELKKLFQSWGIPPWQRNRIPLLYVENKLAVVIGFFISDEFKAGKEQKGHLIQLTQS